MASEEAAAYRAFFRDLMRDLARAGDAPTMRTAFGRITEHAPPLDPGTYVSPVDAGGVTSSWVVPEQADEEVVVWLHGGGYVMGSPATHELVAGHLAQRMKTRVLVVGYGLAPEHPHPEPVEDCLRAYEWLLESGTASDKVAFAGDSAGGALAITTQLLAKRRRIPLPASTACLSPWLDIDPGGDRSSPFARLFLPPDSSSDDELVNPLHGDLSGFGPILVQVGGDEVDGGFVADATALVELAIAGGVPAVLDVVPEMVHMFQLCAGRMPEADAALDRVAAFLIGGLRGWVRVATS